MTILRDIIRHPCVSSAILFLAAGLLYAGYSRGGFLKIVAYLSAMLLAVFITDFLSARIKPANPDFPVKLLNKELIFLLAIQTIIIALSFVRFQGFSDWQNTGFVFKLPVLILMILFVFPVVLLFTFFKWKYALRDLGFRLRGIFIGLPVIFIIGAAAYLFKPEKILFGEIYREMGLISMILTGFLVAAIPEELTRVLVQTRLGRFFENNALGWLIASTVWAFLHLPNFWAQNSEGLVAAARSVLMILPIGLLWGYMTHRTRSIMPAVTVHGTNLWGLQNF